MKLGTKIVTVATASIALTVTASLFIQRSVVRRSSLEALRDPMRVALVSAENSRITVSKMRGAHVFDEAKLKAEAVGVSDYRRTSLYSTVPVVAAWNSIRDVAEKEGYEFRVPADHPRNPQNAPLPNERRILDILDKENLPEYFEIDEAKQEVVYARPIRLTEDCLFCHGDPANSASKDGKDVIGFPMENWKVGQIHGMFLLRTSLASSKVNHVDEEVVAGIWKSLMWLGPLALLIAVGVHFLVKRIGEHLERLTDSVTEGSTQVMGAAQQIAEAAQGAAQGASEQAASLEETSAAAQEITSLTQRNAENATQASQEMDSVEAQMKLSDASLGEMIASMNEINDSSTKIAKIIKVIDDISFQTNILALNAAVEAARAGEAGSGFAVVAEEVRNLASRSAQAAMDTVGLIEESRSKTDVGAAKLTEVVKAVRGIGESASTVRVLVDQVKEGSREQTRGIEQVLRAIQAMEQVTQAAAAHAEQSAATSDEMLSHSNALNGVAKELQGVVG